MLAEERLPFAHICFYPEGSLPRIPQASPYVALAKIGSMLLSKPITDKGDEIIVVKIQQDLLPESRKRGRPELKEGRGREDGGQETRLSVSGIRFSCHGCGERCV